MPTWTPEPTWTPQPTYTLVPPSTPTLAPTPTQVLKPIPTPTLWMFPTATSAPTATATPTPWPTPELGTFITAPQEVWECFLARDDSQRDGGGVKLSPCGWKEDSGGYKWGSHVDIYIVHPGYAEWTDEFEEHVGLLVEVLRDLNLLLRTKVDCDAYPEKPEECFRPIPNGADGIEVRFVDTPGVPCGYHGGSDYLGCAETIARGQRAKITVATEFKFDSWIRGTLRHELLHALADMGHATSGIMETGEALNRSVNELTPMDRAQLWLFSNPLIKPWASLDEIRKLEHHGEWDEPPPGCTSARLC